MTKEVFIEKLNQPNLNGHIYTTKCIEDAIINNNYIQQRVSSGNEFIFAFDKNIHKWPDDGLQLSAVRAIVLKYYIENNAIYATVQSLDTYDIPERCFLAGTGWVDENGIINDYNFLIVFCEE